MLVSESATASGTDFAECLADWICGPALDRLPAEAVVAAKANIFDTLICAAAGSSASGVGEMLGLAREWGGAPQATVLVFGDRLPAHQAAWVNGTMSHARDYDDTHDAAVLHAGVSVVPAALAAMELRGGVDGAALITGVAAGLETISRLGIATRVGIIESGFMYTVLFGHFAATVAAARILGLDRAGVINALGIAYSQAAGNHQVTRDAALTKRMQPGFAVMTALLSVQLARRGVRGAQASFEGVDGFFRVYLRNQYDPAILRDGLGDQYEFTQLSYKPYPCCRFNHVGIEAALLLRRRLEGGVGRIRRIRVGLNRQAYQAVCTPLDVRRSPRTIVQAQFSIPYTVAAALTDGQVGLGHFTDRSCERVDILALAGKVVPYVDEEIEKSHGRNISPTLLEIELDDGTVLRQRVDVPLGHPQRPMTREDVIVKAKDCFGIAASLMGENAHLGLLDQIESMELQKDARVLLDIFGGTRRL